MLLPLQAQSSFRSARSPGVNSTPPPEGFDPGAVDGRLGPQTQQGLKDFQASRGLEPSGQLDPQTVAALGLESDSSAATGGSASDAGQPAPERGAAEPASGDYSSRAADNSERQ
jgi:peptidoglycan hydrolase-like protein with peptidoglycan-binding domain